MATDIGGRLQHARVARGLTLRDVANSTKLSVRALEAIERNAFARLPGGVFRRAYVRAFASEVGLSADELARDYVAAYEPPPPDAPPSTGSDFAGRMLARPGMTIAAIAAAGILALALFLAGAAGERSERAQNDDATASEEAAPAF
jgi:cytoskeletal protein RodZ